MDPSNSTPADGPGIPRAAGPAAREVPEPEVPEPEVPELEVPEPEVPEPEVRELAEIPAVEVITRAAVMLLSAAAEKLGLAEDGARYLDRDEARRLITALAGLYAAAGDDLGAHRRPIADGLRGLQAAFRDASPIPDPPGQGPGESLRRPPGSAGG